MRSQKLQIISQYSFISQLLLESQYSFFIIIFIELNHSNKPIMYCYWVLMWKRLFKSPYFNTIHFYLHAPTVRQGRFESILMISEVIIIEVWPVLASQMWRLESVVVIVMVNWRLGKSQNTKSVKFFWLTDEVIRHLSKIKESFVSKNFLSLVLFPFTPNSGLISLSPSTSTPLSPPVSR